MAVFAAVALLLACLGIYALISYSVGRRSREIGVRLALGARPADVIRHAVARNASQVGGTGLLVGLMLGADDRPRARRHAVRRSGRRVAVCLDGGAAGAGDPAATWLPARRAARVEPTVALRDE